REFPQIDVIMGGHTHHLLRTGEEVNQTLITAAGKHCSFVGEVIITYDHHLESIVKKEAYTSDITNLEDDEETVQLLDHLWEQSNTILHEQVIYTEEPIEVDWYQSVPIMEALTEKVRKKTNADCAMLNAGLLIEGFKKGPITYGDVHHACPHPINPCVVALTGDELTEVIRASLTQAFMDIQLKGFGFRGKDIGMMVITHIVVDIDDMCFDVL